MGQVISLEQYRASHDRPSAAMGKLDGAVARLEPLVRHSPGRLLIEVERELLAIARAVSAGRPQEAAERAERLADRLEHPAALA